MVALCGLGIRLVKSIMDSVTYNYYEKRITTLRAADRLKPGMAIVGLRVEAQGAVPGGPATAILSIDGSEVAREILPETTRGKFSFEDTFDIGEDSGSPVADYSAPFAFPGRIEKVDLVVDPRG
jgi:arylsulfatase